MKKSFLLTVLLLVVGFCVSEGLKAQCTIRQDEIGKATYNARTGGDFVFKGYLSPRFYPYGFTDISPIVTGYRFSEGYLEFSIGEEHIQDLAKNYACYHAGILCRNLPWGGNVGYVRIEFIK